MKRSRKRITKELKAHHDVIAKELKESSNHEDVKSDLDDITRLLDDLIREKGIRMKKSTKNNTGSEIFPPPKYDTIVSYPGKKKPSTTPIKELHFPGEEIEDKTQKAEQKTTEWLLSDDNKFTASTEDTQQREYEELLLPLEGDNSASVAFKDKKTSLRKRKSSSSAQKDKENDWKKNVKRMNKALSKSSNLNSKLNISIASHKKVEDVAAIEVLDEEEPPAVECTGDEKDRRALQEVIRQSSQEPETTERLLRNENQLIVPSKDTQQRNCNELLPPFNGDNSEPVSHKDEKTSLSRRKSEILKSISTDNSNKKPENDSKTRNIIVNGGIVHLNTSDNTNIMFTGHAMNKLCDNIINVIINKLSERYNITEKDRSIERDDLFQNDDNNETELTHAKATESADKAKRTTESVTFDVVNEPLNLESENLFTVTEDELLTPKLDVALLKKVPRPLSARKRKLNQDDNDDDTVEDTPQKIKTKKPTRSTSQSRSIRKSLDFPKKSKNTPLEDAEDDDALMDKTDPSNSNVNLGNPSTDVTPLNVMRFSRRGLDSSTPFASPSKDVTPLDSVRLSGGILKRFTPIGMEAKKSLSFDKKSLGIFEHSQTSSDVIEARRKSEAEKRPIIMTTNLQPGMIKLVEDWVRRFNWVFVNGLYKKEATHLVVGNMGNNKAPRTVKYLQFLVDHKWIVSFEWLKACADKNRYVNEEPYELLDDGGETGPTVSRLSKKKVFSGYTFYLFDFDNPNSLKRIGKDQLTELLQNAGGKVVERLAEASGAERRLAIVDVEQDSSSPRAAERKYADLLERHGFVPLNLEWVFFSLGSQEINSFGQFLLCPAALLPADCFAFSQTCPGASPQRYD